MTAKATKRPKTELRGETATALTPAELREPAPAIARQRTQPAPVNPHDALTLIDKFGEAIADAERLQRSAVRPSRSGDDEITDPQTYAAGTHLKINATRALHTALKDNRNMTALQRFVAAIQCELANEDKEFARRVIALLRKTARDFVTLQSDRSTR
jgi:hypothetical protein